ncbi:hypothetical protein CANARDRAFT_30150 [[Candida] arabinofermentans NRRL YB-2248]|uniref:Prolyl 4-hydroxylase alpha subunit domain-containing protein n=1 Tax=[Candida] arabinofermentans NRRL YB-2248 TaxID=983967 RepID=A0A1E4SUL7_9ASCO|nr:hypothetical protein CANARDRAFT_30150 [[Candida] arabinofermentans NRRL YB-2248]
MAKKQTKQTNKQHPETTTTTSPKFEFPKSITDNSGNNNHKNKIESILKNQIFTISNFLTLKQSNDLINKLNSNENILKTTPLMKNSKLYAARVNDRFSISDTTTAFQLYLHFKNIIEFKVNQGVFESDFQSHDNDVEPHNNEIGAQYGDDDDDDDDDKSWILDEINNSIGFNCNLRLYRYTKGQYFNKHYDESNGNIDVIDYNDDNKNKKGVTKWTVLIYLNSQKQEQTTKNMDSSDLIGGGTIFYDKSSSIYCKPEVGMALFHKHGDDCLLHEGEAVKNGEKWILRTDLVF